MRIIHMSDLHLTKEGCIWDTDTNLHLEYAIEKIKKIPNIDAIVISGDLSNDGSIETYNRLDGIMASIGVVTYCCPGNHDNLYVFFNQFTPTFLKRDKYAVIGNWNFFFLNTVVEGMSRGFTNEKDINILKTEINNSSKNVGIVLHHPPIEQLGWLNRKLLEDRDKFNEIIKKSDKVRMVLYGHTHYHMDREIGGILYSSAGSVGFAFDQALPKFEIAEGRESFSLITIENDKIKVENISIYS